MLIYMDMVRASFTVLILGGILVYPLCGYSRVTALVARPVQSLAFKATPAVVRVGSATQVKAPAVVLATGPKAIAAPTLPGTQPAPLNFGAPTALGQTQFPKMLTPYPNIGTNAVNPNGITQAIQQQPPNTMMPNSNQQQNDPSQMLQQLMSGMGGGGGGGSHGGTGGDDTDTADGGGSSGSYSGIAGAAPGSNLGDGGGHYSHGDLGDYHGGGAGRCNPPVRPEYSQQFASSAPSADINKVAHHGCNQISNDPLVCMVCNIYFEADPGDSDAGHVAVGRSVLTRTVSKEYPDSVCKVVYQHTARVAQYSWIFEHPSWNPTHTLPGPNDARLNRVLRTAVESFKEGPNGFTNYFAQNLVNPSWANGGSCGAGKCTIQHHTFCPIGATQDRSFSTFASANGLSTTRSIASEAADGATR